MKIKDSIIGWALVLSLITILLLIGDFLALHDIRQDYVSSEVIEAVQADSSNNLPDWASTKLEWTFVRISLLLKIIFAPIIVIALAKTVRRLKL